MSAIACDECGNTDWTHAMATGEWIRCPECGFENEFPEYRKI